MYYSEESNIGRKKKERRVVLYVILYIIYSILFLIPLINWMDNLSRNWEWWIQTLAIIPGFLLIAFLSIGVPIIFGNFFEGKSEE